MTKRLTCGKPRISITDKGVIKCDQHNISVECPKTRKKEIFNEECLTSYLIKKKLIKGEEEKK